MGRGLSGGMRLKLVCFFFFFVFTLVEGNDSGTGATETGNWMEGTFALP